MCIPINHSKNMWLDKIEIENSLNFRQLYKDNCPQLSDVVLLGLTMDCVENVSNVQIEFYDWPDPLPDGWIPDRKYCGIFLEFSFKDNVFKHTDFNLLDDNEHCSIVIDDLVNGGFEVKAANRAGRPIFQLTSLGVSITDFYYIDHRED